MEWKGRGTEGKGGDGRGREIRGEGERERGVDKVIERRRTCRLKHIQHKLGNYIVWRRFKRLSRGLFYALSVLLKFLKIGIRKRKRKKRRTNTQVRVKKKTPVSHILTFVSANVEKI